MEFGGRLEVLDSIANIFKHIFCRWIPIRIPSTNIAIYITIDDLTILFYASKWFTWSDLYLNNLVSFNWCNTSFLIPTLRKSYLKIFTLLASSICFSIEVVGHASQLCNGHSLAFGQSLHPSTRKGQYGHGSQGGQWAAWSP